MQDHNVSREIEEAVPCWPVGYYYRAAKCIDDHPAADDDIMVCLMTSLGFAFCVERQILLPCFVRRAKANLFDSYIFYISFPFANGEFP